MRKMHLIALLCCLWSSIAHANNEARMDSLTQALLQHFGSQLPQGITVDEDHKLHIQLRDFLANPTAKRYFEQMGQLIMEEKAAHNPHEVCIEGLHLDSIHLSPQATHRMMRKAVGIPQTTFCLSVPYTYMSVDGKNNPVRLSSIMYHPRPFQLSVSAEVGVFNLFLPALLVSAIIDGVKGLWNTVVGYTFDYAILDCHPTVTSSAEAPSGVSPLDGDIKMFCSDYAIVVCPDYCGYGLSAYKQHPYLVQGVTARNVVDGYLAALDLIQSNRDQEATGSWGLSKDFYTDILGYSQGGSVALATLRYLESGQVSKTDLDRIRLRNTYCGDGPYSPPATIAQYVEWANGTDERYRKLAYPCVLPLIVQAAKDAYDNNCMRTVSVEDYFTPQFLATGILEKLNSKSITTDQLNALTFAQGLHTLDQVLSEKIVSMTSTAEGKPQLELNTESNEYKCLMRALQLNDLTQGWTPQHNLLFMHFSDDLVVPASNMEAVRKQLKPSPNCKMIFTDPYEVKERMSTFWSTASEHIKNTLTNPTHATIGTFFYMAAASGALQEMIK